MPTFLLPTSSRLRRRPSHLLRQLDGGRGKPHPPAGGGVAHAQERWGERLAVGRVNVVSAEGRKPRLVVDNTVCGANDACTINESYSLPMLSSVRHSFPMREFAGTASAFSIDIKAARKTVRVREQDRGLLGLRTELPGQPARCDFYKVCPFGAVFSGRRFPCPRPSHANLDSTHAWHVCGRPQTSRRCIW